MLTRKRRWTSLSSRTMSPRPPGGASSSRPSRESASCLRLALPMPCTMVRIAAMQGIPMWCALYWLHGCIDNIRGGKSSKAIWCQVLPCKARFPRTRHSYLYDSSRCLDILFIDLVMLAWECILQGSDVS